jgi:hypothetical protein
LGQGLPYSSASTRTTASQRKHGGSACRPIRGAPDRISTPQIEQKSAVSDAWFSGHVNMVDVSSWLSGTPCEAFRVL